tara:strand:- start:259 stop:1488 length:1230 start_codon:yes stop_codon:yes gene_type:complete
MNKSIIRSMVAAAIGCVGMSAVGGEGSVTPELIGSHAPGTGIWSTFSVSVERETVYTSWLNAGIDIFDVEQRSAPELITTLGVEVPGPYTLTWETDVYNSIAYSAVDGWGFQGIWIADVRDPSSPVSLGTFDMGGNRDMIAVGDTLYTRYSESAPMSTGSSLGFRMIDISDRSAPSLIVDVESPGTMSGLDVFEGLVYIADGELGLSIYDMSDPANPLVLGSYTSADFYAQDVVVELGLVYVTGGGELNVFDFLGGDLTPVLLGTFEYPNPAEITEVFGNELAVVVDTAYVMNGKEELLVIDARDPSSLQLAGSLVIEGGLVTDIAAKGFEVYLSDEVQGLLVVGVNECRADLNEDGTLNFFDVSAFLELFAAGDMTADFNGNPDGSPDGHLNIFDVSGFLALFSAGCP